MALDLDEMSRRFDEILKSPETDLYFKKLALRQKMERKQQKRFHEKYRKRLDEVIERLEKKYESNAYKDKEYKLGFEPRCPLYYFVFDYACKYCKPCKDKKYWNMFTGGAYYIGSYVIQIMHGQGSVIRIDKKNKK